MNLPSSTVVPLVSAAALPAALVWLFYVVNNSQPDSGLGHALSAGFWLLAIASVMVGVLYFPALAFLQSRGLLNFWSMLLAGFVVAALPWAIWFWPGKHVVPGALAWRIYGYGLLFFGACGGIGAFAHWFTARLIMRSNNRWRGP